MILFLPHRRIFEFLANKFSQKPAILRRVDAEGINVVHVTKGHSLY